MCCCCPERINALLWLWIRSGFSKSSVASALTFFPPEPAYYKFERISNDGNKIPCDEIDLDDDDDDKEGIRSSAKNNLNATAPLRGSIIQSPVDDDDQSACSAASLASSIVPVIIGKKTANPQRKISLVEKSKHRHLDAKQRKLRDTRDAAIGVTYRFVLDPRLEPWNYNGSVDSIKIYSPGAESYIATNIYRLNSVVKYTLIYSHGNATDIGAMSLVSEMISTWLNVNVVLYDYSGYGESGGVVSEKNVYSDIEAVYKYTVEKEVYGRTGNIIIYGQSLGSGPSCYIASKMPVGGLILHSGFTSGMRILTKNRALGCLDIFPNIDRLKKVKCPVLVIHGAKDTQINFDHGLDLYSVVPKKFQRDPYWVPDRGHNDIVEGPGKMGEYINRILNFMASLPVDQ